MIKLLEVFHKNLNLNAIPNKKKKRKTTYLATFPKSRYNEYFKTTFSDDLERYVFEYTGIGVDLTSLKEDDFFFYRLLELLISASVYLIKTCEKTSLSKKFNIIS